MSGRLAGEVWQSGLPSRLKPLAAVLADIANDDGTSIYPSVAYVAWRLGRSTRAVQVGLAELKQMGILQVVAHAYGGRGHATEYRFIKSSLPKRPGWAEYRRKKGEDSAPFPDTSKGEVFATKGEAPELERAQFPKPKDEGTCTPTVMEPPEESSRTIPAELRKRQLQELMRDGSVGDFNRHVWRNRFAELNGRESLPSWFVHEVETVLEQWKPTTPVDAKAPAKSRS